VLKAEGIEKRFGDQVAVAGVSFEVAAGETLGLLGPNGAGKTTTFRILNGTLDADAGSVSCDGSDDPHAGDYRRRLGCAPQSIALYEELTGAENLRFTGRLYGLGGQHLADRVAWCLEFAGLSDRAGDRVGTYSGGMQRRLNMVAALVHEPRVLLFDEPTVGVDPQSRNHLFEAVEQLRGGGCAIVYTTHYMEEAERLCDRVAIIDRGKVLDLDTVDALIERHGGAAVVRAKIAGEVSDDFPFELTDGVLQETTADPEQIVSKIFASGARVASLHVDRPDLEAVFLNLTGRSLRDA